MKPSKPDDAAQVRVDIKPENFPETFRLFNECQHAAISETTAHCDRDGIPDIVAPVVLSALFNALVRTLDVRRAAIAEAMKGAPTLIHETHATEDGDGILHIFDMKETGGYSGIRFPEENTEAVRLPRAQRRAPKNH